MGEALAAILIIPGTVLAIAGSLRGVRDVNDALGLRLMGMGIVLVILGLILLPR